MPDPDHIPDVRLVLLSREVEGSTWCGLRIADMTREELLGLAMWSMRCHDSMANQHAQDLDELSDMFRVRVPR